MKFKKVTERNIATIYGYLKRFEESHFKSTIKDGRDSTHPVSFYMRTIKIRKEEYGRPISIQLFNSCSSCSAIISEDFVKINSNGFLVKKIFRCDLGHEPPITQEIKFEKQQEPIFSSNQEKRKYYQTQ